LILAAMADVAYRKSDLGGATAFAERALHGAPRAPVAFRLRINNTLGKVAYSRERYADADATFEDNLRVAEEQRLAPEAVLARINMGLCRHRLGRHAEAREVLERALAGARAIGDLANEAAALAAACPRSRSSIHPSITPNTMRLSFANPTLRRMPSWMLSRSTALEHSLASAFTRPSML
jgi:tetratricopeptide (TPR) repeat protein